MDSKQYRTVKNKQGKWITEEHGATAAATREESVNRYRRIISCLSLFNKISCWQMYLVAIMGSPIFISKRTISWGTVMVEWKGTCDFKLTLPDETSVGGTFPYIYHCLEEANSV